VRRKVVCCLDQVDLTDYEKSGTWDVVSVPGEFKTHYDQKEKQNVSRAIYTIVMRRKTLFYTVNLILPCVLVSMLSMVVFYLPTTAGEKVTMSVSIFLALIVYLQVLVTNLLPPSSLSLPLFAKYLLFTVIVDVCCIINTIISVNLSFRTPRTHVLSPAMRKFFFQYLARFLMMRRPGDSEPAQAAPTTTSLDPELLDLSELHHINCPYARLSARQRRRALDAEASCQSTNYDGLRHEYNKAVEAVRFAAAHLKNEDDFGEVRPHVHGVSKKPPTVSQSISLPNVNRFSIFFTATFCAKFAITWLSNIPPHRNYVATLPCKI